MIRRPPRSTRTCTLFPSPTRSRSDNVTILSAAGEEALLVGDSDAAFGFLGRAVTLSPRDPRVRAAYGRALVMSARPKDALTLFRQAVDLGMLEGAVAGDRGLARDLLGDGRKAQRDYRLALTARPGDPVVTQRLGRSEEHTSELQSLMRISYAVLCLK